MALADLFPAHNAGSVADFGEWLDIAVRETEANQPERPASGPVIPNLIVHRSNVHRAGQIEAIVSGTSRWSSRASGHRSRSSRPCTKGGCAVLADVASVRHAHRAADAGADGLVLLCAGGGGQTGLG